MDAGGRYYVCGSVLPFEEDKRHEFKAHRNICVEELPHWAFVKGTLRRSRRAVSRTLNGFLNTGLGGTVYLGVLDDGVVKGIQFTPQQMDHIRLSVEDVLSRYKPAVSTSRFQVVFVPVVEREVAKCTPSSSSEGSCYSYGVGSDDSCGDTSSSSSLTSGRGVKGCGRGVKGPSSFSSRSELQRLSHTLRSPSFCWCDEAAVALTNKGVNVPKYVVEITIHPFTYRKDVEPIVLQLHPVHEDEEGRVYMRGSASLHPMTYQEVAQMTERQASDHFERVLKSLHEELLQCEMKLH